MWSTSPESPSLPFTMGFNKKTHNRKDNSTVLHQTYPAQPSWLECLLILKSARFRSDAVYQFFCSSISQDLWFVHYIHLLFVPLNASFPYSAKSIHNIKFPYGDSSCWSFFLRRLLWRYRPLPSQRDEKYIPRRTIAFSKGNPCMPFSLMCICAKKSILVYHALFRRAWTALLQFYAQNI